MLEYFSMKIIVMSDSHMHDEKVQMVIDANKDADIFIHCGDLCSEPALFPNVEFVKGNNDFNIEERFKVLEYDGVKIYVTHGDKGYGYYLEDYLVNKAKENQCQLVFFGHIHRFYDETIDNIRLLNPGSLMYNRNGESIGYLEINTMNGNYNVIKRKLEG